MELRRCVPNSYENYFEPFFGGGALFFDLKPKNAIVNDFNKQLINMYKQIKLFPDEVIKHLLNYQNTYNNFCSDNEKTR